MAADVSRGQERQLLSERAGEIAAILNVSTSESRSMLLVAGSTTSAPNGAKTFETVTAATAQSGASIGVVRRSGGSFSVVRSAGLKAPAPGASLDPAAAAVVAKALGSQGMVSGVFDVGSLKHVVLALATGSNEVAYLDSAMDPTQQAPSSANSPYRELDVALYAGKTADPKNLLLVSGDRPGAHGSVVTKQFQVGTDTWSLAVSARQPLIGSFATAFPWVLGGSGLLTAAVLGLLIETLVRRREYALGLVDERTALLQEAQREAERANQAREEFFASVSHDIRTPLTAIMGFTELMTSAEPEDRKRV